jgi:hypothetical protein
MEFAVESWVEDEIVVAGVVVVGASACAAQEFEVRI